MLEQHFYPEMNGDSPDNQNDDNDSGIFLALFICVALIVFYLRLTMIDDDCYTAASSHNVIGRVQPQQEINLTEKKSDNG